MAKTSFAQNIKPYIASFSEGIDSVAQQMPSIMDHDVTELLQAAMDKADDIKSELQHYAKLNWQQDSNSDKASRQRHDLYTLFTKIHFAIEITLKMHPELSPEQQSVLRTAHQQSKALFQELRSYLSTSK